ncbi:hypothetical protein cyc_01516 [Cyclospora cayetanensis]|uniref:RNase III domain-containing protein n=1 Tax=Cyclospora cayetanensis TaxID=88456 RepID=A0A1D3D6X7_9EIME|nr:hypothetical protein cyc_01516 [Cyclospora cayetanensis]
MGTWRGDPTGWDETAEGPSAESDNEGLFFGVSERESPEGVEERSGEEGFMRIEIEPPEEDMQLKVPNGAALTALLEFTHEMLLRSLSIQNFRPTVKYSRTGAALWEALFNGAGGGSPSELSSASLRLYASNQDAFASLPRLRTPQHQSALHKRIDGATDPVVTLSQPVGSMDSNSPSEGPQDQDAEGTSVAQLLLKGGVSDCHRILLPFFALAPLAFDGRALNVSYICSLRALKCFSISSKWRAEEASRSLMEVYGVDTLRASVQGLASPSSALRFFRSALQHLEEKQSSPLSGVDPDITGRQEKKVPTEEMDSGSEMAVEDLVFSPISPLLRVGRCFPWKDFCKAGHTMDSTRQDAPRKTTSKRCLQAPALSGQGKEKHIGGDRGGYTEEGTTMKKVREACVQTEGTSTKFFEGQGLHKRLLSAALTCKASRLPGALDSGGNAWHSQRLEFLGDSVLGFVVAMYIFFTNFKWEDEGALSRRKSSYVCNKHLAAKAREMGIAGHLLARPFTPSATLVELREQILSSKMLADAVEALTAAVYLSNKTLVRDTSKNSPEARSASKTSHTETRLGVSGHLGSFDGLIAAAAFLDRFVLKEASTDTGEEDTLKSHLQMDESSRLPPIVNVLTATAQVSASICCTPASEPEWAQLDATPLVAGVPHAPLRPDPRVIALLQQLMRVSHDSTATSASLGISAERDWRNEEAVSVGKASHQAISNLWLSPAKVSSEVASPTSSNESSGAAFWRDRDLNLPLVALSRTAEAPAAARGGPTATYQLLEFLGDSALGFVVSEWLFSLFPEVREGPLTIIKSRLVSNSFFAAKMMRKLHAAGLSYDSLALGWDSFSEPQSWPCLCVRERVIQRLVALPPEEDFTREAAEVLSRLAHSPSNAAGDNSSGCSSNTPKWVKQLGDIYEALASATLLSSGFSFEALWAAVSADFEICIPQLESFLLALSRARSSQEEHVDT